MKTVKDYSNFIKVEHTLFSLPIIFAGVFLSAGGAPSLRLIVLIMLAGIGARTAALAINRIIDREIDSKNPRTMQRELPSGKISVNNALLLTFTGIFVYLFAAYKICWLVFILSPIPLTVFIVYPLMKRFTPLCHFGVGLGLALAPLGGWVAASCSFSDIYPAILLTLFTLFWVAGFDIIYATLDEEFDLNEGIYSMVSVYGRAKALAISGFAHLLSFIILLFLYVLYIKTFVSGLALILIGYFLYLEYKKSSDVDLAFFKINIIIGILIFVFIVSGIYLP